MKTKLLTLALALLLAACSSPLDKKVVLTEWKETIETIKTKTDAYSDEDYNVAGDMIAGKMFGAMLEGEAATGTQTYREILDAAKASNEEKAKEREAKEKKMQELREVMNIEVVGGRYHIDSNPYTSYPHRYTMKVNVAATAPVAALKGKIVCTNEVGSVLFTHYLNEAVEVPANETLEAEITKILDKEDNLVELEALPSDKLSFVWEPQLVLLADGTRMAVE